MRNIDCLGRVTLPKNIREKYNFKEGTSVQIIEKDNSIEIIPTTKKHYITENDMEVLRKLYVMLESAGMLDDYYNEVLAKITNKSDLKCDKCGSSLFITPDNTYKCYKCE